MLRASPEIEKVGKILPFVLTKKPENKKPNFEGELKVWANGNGIRYENMKDDEGIIIDFGIGFSGEEVFRVREIKDGMEKNRSPYLDESVSFLEQVRFSFPYWRYIPMLEETTQKLWKKEHANLIELAGRISK